MNIQFPSYRRLWTRAKTENRALRGERNQLLIDVAVANIRADRATKRADALEKANEELRSDWASWMNREMSSDG